MESEDANTNNVTNVRQDIKRLIRIRGGHKGAFTKSEPKIDALLNRPISNQDQLCEAEALLSSLKTQWNMVHRYDAGIELLIDDETELIAEIEANAVFDEKANVSIARVESLINTYKQKQQTRSSLTSSSSATSTANTMKLPKLQLPTFTG